MALVHGLTVESAALEILLEPFIDQLGTAAAGEPGEFDVGVDHRSGEPRAHPPIGLHALGTVDHGNGEFATAVGNPFDALVGLVAAAAVFLIVFASLETFLAFSAEQLFANANETMARRIRTGVITSTDLKTSLVINAEKIVTANFKSAIIVSSTSLSVFLLTE